MYNEEMSSVLNNSLKTIFFSYSFFYFADSLIVPLFALFTTNIGGGIEIVGLLFGLRTFVSAITGLIMSRIHDSGNRNSLFVKINLIARAVVWLVIAFYVNVPVFIAAQIIIGITDGIGTPAFNSLVSTNLNKNKTIGGWAVWHILGSLSVAIANASGAVILAYSSFQTMFILMAGIAFISFCIIQIYETMQLKPQILHNHVFQFRTAFALIGVTLLGVITIAISYSVYTQSYTVGSQASDYTGETYEQISIQQAKQMKPVDVTCLSSTEIHIRLLFLPDHQSYTLKLDNLEDEKNLSQCTLESGSRCAETGPFAQYDCFIGQTGNKCISLTNPTSRYSIQSYKTFITPYVPYRLTIQSESGKTVHENVSFSCI
jgi:hypothetical protein